MKNEAEYEALIIELHMVKDLDIKKITVLCDSQLVVNQITGSFEAKEPQMIVYLQMAKDLASCFDFFEILHVLR